MKRSRGIGYRGENRRVVEEVTRRLCAFGMRAGIFPRRDLLSRFIARVVPTSMLGERERERGGGVLFQPVRSALEERKKRLAKPAAEASWC